jgi:two-component system sensor histidine kinase DegS
MAGNVSSVNDFLSELESEYEQAQKTLKEIDMMLDQSQSELSKLIQRNTSASTHLQQIQNQFDTVPRIDIKQAYNSALDSQQRMLVMRSQLEKLQNDQSNLKKRVMLIDEIRQFFPDQPLIGKTSKITSLGSTGSNEGLSVLEMMINSQETERQRLSRQMHDGPAQALSNFIVQTEIASRLFEIDKEKAKNELENLKGAAMSTFQKVRNFISELRPMMLDDLGLMPTFKKYVDIFKEQHGVDVNLTINGQDRRLESYLEVMIFRALQELMGNAVRHNQDQPVKVQLNVQIALDENQIKVAVSDNGKGFNPDDLKTVSGLGLKLIRDRVEMLGGFFDLDTSVDQGCRVSLTVPIISLDKE